jgi:hypothetical protein
MPGGRLGKAEDGSIVYSETPRAIREREKRRLKLEARVLENIRSYSPETPPEVPPPGVSYNTEDIGIKTRAKVESNTIRYVHNPGCGSPLEKNEPQCPICEEEIDWSGLA